MGTILNSLKTRIADWCKSASSKRLQAAIITSIFTTIGTQTGWLSETQALSISGMVIAVIVGDSYRPINPSKVSDDGSQT